MKVLPHHLLPEIVQPESIPRPGTGFPSPSKGLFSGLLRALEGKEQASVILLGDSYSAGKNGAYLAAFDRTLGIAGIGGTLVRYRDQSGQVEAVEDYRQWVNGRVYRIGAGERLDLVYYPGWPKMTPTHVEIFFLKQPGGGTFQVQAVSRQGESRKLGDPVSTAFPGTGTGHRSLDAGAREVQTFSVLGVEGTVTLLGAVIRDSQKPGVILHGWNRGGSAIEQHLPDLSSSILGPALAQVEPALIIINDFHAHQPHLPRMMAKIEADVSGAVDWLLATRHLSFQEDQNGLGARQAADWKLVAEQFEGAYFDGRSWMQGQNHALERGWLVPGNVHLSDEGKKAYVDALFQGMGK